MGTKRTWLSPMAVVTIADPKPVVTLTLIPPIMLHTIMYQSMLFLPYLWTAILVTPVMSCFVLLTSERTRK